LLNLRLNHPVSDQAVEKEVGERLSGQLDDGRDRPVSVWVGFVIGEMKNNHKN